MSASRPDLLAKLNAAQAELHANEPYYIESLREKYYPVSMTSRAFSADERAWISDHKSLRVGVLDNYLPYSDLDDAGEVTGIVKDVIPAVVNGLDITSLEIDFVGYDSYDAMVADMDAGLIDVAFPVGGGLYYSEENGISHDDECCFGVHIGNEGLLKLLNRGISVIGEDYALNRASNYTGGLYRYTFGDFVGDHTLPFVAAVLGVVGLIVGISLRDVRRERRQRAELSSAIDKAERANRAKTTFLNNMSHDIRTQMNAVIGFTDLAISHIDERDNVLDYLSKISVSSQHLLSLINDVLDMSRIESGKVVIEKAEVRLPEVVRDLQTIVQSSADDKHQTFDVDVSGITHELVITDKLRLNQILLNTLSNAVKFTPEGGTISLVASEHPTDSPDLSDFEFRIRDNGIGMSEEFVQTIFEPFTRERTSTVSGIQGTGLGMAITKRIVDMMGGTILVVSAEGEGSEFVVTISCQTIEDERGAAGTTTDPRPSQEERDADLAETIAGKHILLVEDNLINQEIAKAMLGEAGLVVDIVSDGTEAVATMEAAPAGTYDLILMDIQMPVMDGYEATRCIRSLDDPYKAQIPIIAMTANAFEEDRQQAQDAGMNDHLAKPYEIPKMMATMARYLDPREDGESL